MLHSSPAPLKWFCAVKSNGQITAKTTDLATAQKSLGIGNRRNRQLIAPMTGRKAGDPHTLSKKWSGGSMWWWNWSDIKRMQAFCEKTDPPSPAPGTIEMIIERFDPFGYRVVDSC